MMVDMSVAMKVVMVVKMVVMRVGRKADQLDLLVLPLELK